MSHVPVSPPNKASISRGRLPVTKPTSKIFTPASSSVSTALNCSPTSTSAQLKECAENIAIHEFGHVLGFAHEQNYPGSNAEWDFPSNCASRQEFGGQTPGEELYNNDWDLDSVMNYCNPHYGGPKLSKLDAGGMRKAYGFSRRMAGALVAADVI